jgi:hypothetical protein
MESGPGDEQLGGSPRDCREWVVYRRHSSCEWWRARRCRRDIEWLHQLSSARYFCHPARRCDVLTKPTPTSTELVPQPSSSRVPSSFLSSHLSAARLQRAQQRYPPRRILCKTATTADFEPPFCPCCERAPTDLAISNSFCPSSLYSLVGRARTLDGRRIRKASLQPHGLGPHQRQGPSSQLRPGDRQTGEQPRLLFPHIPFSHACCFCLVPGKQQRNERRHYAQLF